MTRKILLIKTSSLGDVIHTLPAVTDVRSAGLAARLDWVVEESLVEIARLHPAVNDVIPVAIRRWRRGWWRRTARDEIGGAIRRMRVHAYDDVIDAQGLFKSALLAMMVRGTRHGLDFHSAREPLAPFYQHTYRIGWDLHAVERTRRLFARALGYDVPAGCDYGIRSVPRDFSWLGGRRYAVLLHATSGAYKLWDERNWCELGAALNARGLTSILPWGSTHERERSARIAAKVPDAVVPPVLCLSEIAGLLAGAEAVAGVDTGLTHLAAALGVPTVGIYNATDPAATGIYGCARALNVGGMGGAPTARDVTRALTELAP